MDNFRVIYRILRYLENAMDYDEADMDFVSAFNLGITENRLYALLGMLAKAGYISGLSYKVSCGKNKICRISPYGITITLKGLAYLVSDPIMAHIAMENETGQNDYIIQRTVRGHGEGQNEDCGVCS